MVTEYHEDDNVMNGGIKAFVILIAEVILSFLLFFLGGLRVASR